MLDALFSLLISLAGFIAIALPIIAVVSLIRSVRLRRDLATMEQRLIALEAMVDAVIARTTAQTEESGAENLPDKMPVSPPQPPPETAIIGADTPPLSPEPTAKEIDKSEHPRPGLEKQLGTRIYVWLGGTSLALAAVFFVRYAIELGLLGPTTRVTLGILFGIALLVAGERTRGRTERIPQALSGAGVTALFVSLLAAVNLYHLIEPLTGFVVMALVSAGAVLLSLRQGAFVALLGLAGGYITPLLIATPDPQAAPLFAYFFILEAGLLVVAVWRGWLWLAALAIAASMAGVAVWLATHYEPADGAILGLFLLATAAIYLAVLSRVDPHRLTAAANRAALAPADPLRLETPEAQLNLIALATGITALALQALIVQVGGHATTDWLLMATLAVGAICAGRWHRQYELLAGWSALLGFALLASWPLSGTSPAIGRFAWVALSFGVLHCGGAFAALWGANRPERWAGLSGIAAVLYLSIAYARLASEAIGCWPYPCLDTRYRVFPWGMTTLIVAGLAVAAAGLLERIARQRPGYHDALGAYAATATALIALAAGMQLEDAWIAIAWALEIPALAWISHKLAIRWLRQVAWPLAAGVMVNLTLLWVDGYPVGQTPIFNAILYGFGVPLIAFITSARMFCRGGDDALVTTLEACAVALGFGLITLEILHLYHPEQSPWFFSRKTFSEAGLISTAWLAMGYGLMIANNRYRRISLANGGVTIALLGCWHVIWAQGLTHNPLLNTVDVGSTPILNAIWLAYGGPALLVGLVARTFENRGETFWGRIAGAGALFLLFALISLLVRQAFQGPLLNGHGVTTAESYAYSMAWLLLGTVLLVTGMLSSSLALRHASLVVTVLAVGKVFLLDMADLTGLYRVFSFLGLGVVLLCLAFLYQRFVFADRPVKT